MKIRKERASIHSARPDFALLQEEFHLVQSATPTAIASEKARVSKAQAESLLRLFAGVKAGDRAAGSGSFHAGLTPGNDDGRQDGDGVGIKS